MMNQKTVIKLGGSLLYKEDKELDIQFLRMFANWFAEAKKTHERIVVIVGGGKMSRYMVDQVRVFEPEEEDLHRIGMAITNTNADILRAILNDKEINVPKTLGQALEMTVDKNPKFVITGGFKEGWSTDMDAAVLAHVLGANKVHKLSNIDHVYTADPKTNPDARVIKDLSWDEYFTQFGIVKGLEKHAPGLSVPVGAFCAQFSAEKGISFMLSGGETIKDHDSLATVMQTGTMIHP